MTAPRLYLGETVELKSLQLDARRRGSRKSSRSLDLSAFQCPSCAAPPANPPASDIQTVACGSCGVAVIDTSNLQPRHLSQSTVGQKSSRPAAGQPGRLRGISTTPSSAFAPQNSHRGPHLRLGMNTRFTATKRGLLAHGIRRHWNLAKGLSGLLGSARQPPQRQLIRTDYPHLQTARLPVSCVIGEFYWK